MRIAIPVSEGILAAHFGHCDTFAMFDIEEEGKTVVAINEVTPPPHAPGLLPRWLAENGANVIIAGGMGQKAIQLFVQNGIKVFTGAAVVDPETLVKDFMQGSLSTGTNLCDH